VENLNPWEPNRGVKLEKNCPGKEFKKTLKTLNATHNAKELIAKERS